MCSCYVFDIITMLRICFSTFLSLLSVVTLFFFFFFFNDTATTEIYTLSLHDGSSDLFSPSSTFWFNSRLKASWAAPSTKPDRKSTRLNSSHSQISYAVFCLKKKKKKKKRKNRQKKRNQINTKNIEHHSY